jgi:hypothetical protein
MKPLNGVGHYTLGRGSSAFRLFTDTVVKVSVPNDCSRIFTGSGFWNTVKAEERLITGRRR